MVNSQIEQKFKYEDFDKLDIANLMVNIWHYPDTIHRDCCVVCTNYKNWCITVLKKKWKDWYIDIDFAVEKLCKRDKAWEKVMSKITIEHMSKLYVLIEGKKFFK